MIFLVAFCLALIAFFLPIAIEQRKKSRYAETDSNGRTEARRKEIYDLGRRCGKISEILIKRYNFKPPNNYTILNAEAWIARHHIIRKQLMHIKMRNFKRARARLAK